MSDADTLDAAIDDVLAGRSPATLDDPTAAVVMRLSAASREPAPTSLSSTVANRLRKERQRRWIPARVAAAALAVAFASHSFGAFFLGEWIAEQIDGHYDRHTSIENGVVFLALTFLLVAGATRLRWLDAAAMVAAPIGVFLGINGAPELVTAPNAGILHMSEGISAFALIALWWWARRYGRPAEDEGET
jgi:hypothetical protein